MLARKGSFIILLISLIAGYFYFKPFFHGKKIEPSILDRLPVGDFLGQIFVLDVAREANSFLYYNKIPFRDFLTYEFILAQGKNYGLDLQKPIYFFANESGEWGSLISLNDSSKIIAGINRVKQYVDFEDTLVGGQKVTKISDEKIYMTYGKQWLFFYHGNQLPKRMYHVIYSKKNDIHPAWKKFIKQRQFADESIIIYSTWKKIQDNGIETAMFSYDCDSVQLHLKAYLKSKELLNVSIKDSGITLLPQPTMNKEINLHLNTAKLRNNPTDPSVKWLTYFSKKISFPINEFLQAWEGDLTLQEGGTQIIKESYIETEFDDDFNPIEVKKEKEVKVPRYTVLLSMNNLQKQFVSTLFSKGILRKQNNRYHFLSSPPLKISQKPNYLMVYSSQNPPKILTGKENRGYWTTKNTTYHFNIDYLNHKEAYFFVHFPGMSLFKKNKFLF